MAKNIQMNVLGSDGQYEDIYPQTTVGNIVDIQDNYYTKNETLTNTTAALFGLGSDAVPDDVLNILSRFQSGLGNEYLWAKGTYAEKLTIIGRTNILSYSSGNPATAEYGDSISFDSEGNAFIVNSQTVQVGYAADGIIDDSNFVNLIKGKYALCNNVLYRFDSDAKFSTSGGISRNLFVESGGNTVGSKIVNIGYVNSQYDDAYPPSVPDGYIYNALGRLGDKANIVIGSYVGTGTYGVNNPNTLTFEIEPKFVFIVEIVSEDNNYTNGYPTLLLVNPSVRGYYLFAQGNDDYSYIRGVVLKWIGNTVSWFNSNSLGIQLNAAGVSYAYIAIGGGKGAIEPPEFYDVTLTTPNFGVFN